MSLPSSVTYLQYQDMLTRYNAYYTKYKVYPAKITLPTSMISDVTGAGMKSCIKCSLSSGSTKNSVAVGPFYKSTVKNYCANCGRYGTVTWVQGADYNTCGSEDNPGYEGMYVCCTTKGGCDTDWCICGVNHGWKTGKKALTVTSAATKTSAAITLDGDIYYISKAQMSDMITRVNNYITKNGKTPSIVYIK